MSTKNRLAAIFVFNHRFEGNLPVLDRIYGERFSRRHTIMPFAGEPGPNVSRVYELGRNFAGHIAQGASDFLADDITHYVFIGDDLLLNPRLNEGNLIDQLGLQPGQAYIKNLIAADCLRDDWIWAGEAAAKFKRNEKAIDWSELLPAPEDAHAKFEAMALAIPRKPGGSLGQKLSKHRRFPRERAWAWLEGLSLRGQPSLYPFLSGYSDFLVIPAPAMADFVRYCGILAALDIFAEIAIPTALALACNNIKTELAPNQHFRWLDPKRASDARFTGVEIWTPRDSTYHADLLSLPLDRLLAEFPEEWLYIHPVKLSRFASQQ